MKLKFEVYCMSTFHVLASPRESNAIMMVCVNGWMFCVSVSLLIIYTTIACNNHLANLMTLRHLLLIEGAIEPYSSFSILHPCVKHVPIIVWLNLCEIFLHLTFGSFQFLQGNNGSKLFCPFLQ